MHMKESKFEKGLEISNSINRFCFCHPNIHTHLINLHLALIQLHFNSLDYTYLISQYPFVKRVQPNPKLVFNKITLKFQNP